MSFCATRTARHEYCLCRIESHRESEHSQRRGLLVGVTSPLHSKPLNERYRLWLLKNSIFSKTAEIWGIENVLENRESRL